MANIDDFKANLIGGGARANQFRVTITPPSGIAIGLDVRRSSFLVTASNLPGSTLGEIAVPFRGRNIYVTGDRPALDRDDVVLKTYIFRNAFPLTIGTIDLSSAEAGELETFEVTWRYQHFEPSGVSF